MTIFTTKDGRSILIRRINQNDAPQLVDMFFQSSEHTWRMRFHCNSSNCSDEKPLVYAALTPNNTLP